MPDLAGLAKVEAVVLLTEALQEQGRWLESLDALGLVDFSDASLSTSLAVVQRTRARRRLGLIGGQELDELPHTLLTFIESTADTGSRIRAAVEAASIFDTSARPELAPSMLQQLQCIDAADLEPDDAAHLLLAKSMLFYSTRNLTSSLECIAEATAILQKQRSSNSALAMFHQGSGAIMSKQGAYKASVSAYLLCHETASRVGNDAIASQASANLSLSFLRLGEYDASLKWATRALAFHERETGPHFCLPAVHSTVLSYAMLGRSSEAEAAIRDGTELFGSFGSLARSQAWALYSADGYAMLGRTEQAQREGVRATSGVNSEVHITRYVGPYARWVARTSMHLGSTFKGHQRLDNLIVNLETYDAVDKLEVLNAKAWLSAQTGKATSEELTNMRLHLRELPAAVGDQLTRIGMLDGLSRS